MKSPAGISRTTTETALLVKYWFALLLLVMAILIGGKDLLVYPARIPFVAALIISGVFCLTAAEVRADENALKYRRFLAWKQISYDQIRECRDSLLPGFGYLSLTQFMSPWGRLYFVTARSAFTGDPKELVAKINSRRGGARSSEPIIDDRANGADENKGVRFCALMAFVGAVYGLLWSFFFPDYLRPTILESFPQWVEVPMGLWQRAMTWPWAIGTMTVLIVTILWLHFKNRAWILAWAFGALLGSMLTRSIH